MQLTTVYLPQDDVMVVLPFACADVFLCDSPSIPLGSGHQHVYCAAAKLCDCVTYLLYSSQMRVHSCVIYLTYLVLVSSHVQWHFCCASA